MFLECLRQKQGAWYTPFEEYIIPLFLSDIRGVYHNPCLCLKHSRSISYTLFLSETFQEYTIPLVFVWDIRVVYNKTCVSDKNKGYDILLDVLRKIQGLWYTPGMSQADTNTWHDVLLEYLIQKQVLWYTPWSSTKNTRLMIYPSNVSNKNNGRHARRIP
jgi:hypothetical protein